MYAEALPSSPLLSVPHLEVDSPQGFPASVGELRHRQGQRMAVVVVRARYRLSEQHLHLEPPGSKASRRGFREAAAKDFDRAAWLPALEAGGTMVRLEDGDVSEPHKAGALPVPADCFPAVQSAVEPPVQPALSPGAAIALPDPGATAGYQTARLSADQPWLRHDSRVVPMRIVAFDPDMTRRIAYLTFAAEVAIDANPNPLVVAINAAPPESPRATGAIAVVSTEPAIPFSPMHPTLQCAAIPHPVASFEDTLPPPPARVPSTSEASGAYPPLERSGAYHAGGSGAYPRAEHSSYPPADHSSYPPPDRSGAYAIESHEVIEAAPTAASDPAPLCGSPLLLEGIWFDADGAAEVRASTRLSGSAHPPGDPPRGNDGRLPPPRRPGGRTEPPPPPRRGNRTHPTRTYLDVMRHAPVTPLSTLPFILDAALGDASDEPSSLVLVEGNLTLSFDTRRELSALVALARPLAPESAELAEAIDRAELALSTPLEGDTTAARHLCEGIKHAWQACRPSLPEDHLAHAIRRYLLTQRAYDTVELLGGPYLRAELSGFSDRAEPVVVYLPEDCRSRLPLYNTLRVRLVADARPRQDARERGPVALRVLGVARLAEPAAPMAQSA